MTLRRTLSKWETAGPTPGAYYGTRDPKATRQVAIVLDGEGANALWSATVSRYEQTSQPLNLTSTTEYGYDTSMTKATAQTAGIDSFALTNSLAVRTTETAYLDDAAYTARNLTALPEAVTVRSGLPVTGAVVARAETRYDEYDVAAFQMLSCGAGVGWGDPGSTARGNVTTSRRWLDTTGTFLAEYAQNAAPTSPRKEYGYRAGELLVTAECPPRTNVALSSAGGQSLRGTRLKPSGSSSLGKNETMKRAWTTSAQGTTLQRKDGSLALIRSRSRLIVSLILKD